MTAPRVTWAAAMLVLTMMSACRLEEDLGTAFIGPECDCKAYFPMCVGAEWTYWVVDQQTAIGTEKSLTIVDWADPRHDRHGMTGFLAYQQRRATANDAKDSWLARTPDGLAVLWLIDEWFDVVGRRTRTQYYEPGRYRIDESPDRLVSGTTWSEHFTEYRIEWSEGDAEIVLEHDVMWETLDPADHGEFTAAACQHKVDTIRDGSGNVFESRAATYCFTPGVGKVYELTPLVDEEELIQNTIPGCQ